MTKEKKSLDCLYKNVTINLHVKFLEDIQEAAMCLSVRETHVLTQAENLLISY